MRAFGRVVVKSLSGCTFSKLFLLSRIALQSNIFIIAIYSLIDSSPKFRKFRKLYELNSYFTFWGVDVSIRRESFFSFCFNIVVLSLQAKQLTWTCYPLLDVWWSETWTRVKSPSLVLRRAINRTNESFEEIDEEETPNQRRF